MILIDTPGTNSLSKLESDITFGYLPYLDGAVICQTVEKGSLPQTMINFLLKPEIKKLAKNFIFAITNSDLKPLKTLEKIKSEIVSQLDDLNNKHNLGFDNINDIVVLTAINKKEKKLDDFYKIYSNKFIKKILDILHNPIYIIKNNKIIFFFKPLSTMWRGVGVREKRLL